MLAGAATFGAFFPLSTAISDICVVANESFFTETPRSDYFLDVVLSCAEDSPIMAINNYATAALDNTTTLICNILTEACDTSLPCGSDASGTSTRMCPLIATCPSAPCTAQTVDEWARMPVHDYYIGCFDYITKNFIFNITGGTCPYDPAATTTDVCGGMGSQIAPGICNGDTSVAYPLDECAGECSSQVLRDMAREISQYYEQYKKLAAVIEDEILPLFNCVTVKELFAELMDFVCYGTMAAMKPITASVCVMAVLAMCATVVGIVSIKRFNKKYRMDEYIDDDDENGDNNEVELEGGERKRGGGDDSDSDDAFGAGKN